MHSTTCMKATEYISNSITCDTHNSTYPDQKNRTPKPLHIQLDERWQHFNLVSSKPRLALASPFMLPTTGCTRALPAKTECQKTASANTAVFITSFYSKHPDSSFVLEIYFRELGVNWKQEGWRFWKVPYFPTHKTHWPIRRTMIFSLEILERNNDEYILILVIYWKKTGLLHTKISNHNIIY